MNAVIGFLACYFIVAMLTFGVLFHRFVGRRDLRGRDAFELVDPTDGLLACLVFFFLAFFVLAVANPIRFAQMVLKAAFWPVTAWFWLQARTAPSDSTADGGAGAPRLGASFFRDILVREGFPTTPHNVFALQERLGIMFTTKAKQFMEATGDLDDWNAFVARAGYPQAATEMASWPQRLLDALVAWDADVAPHLRDFPTKYVDMLLEGKGTGSGFFGGSPDEPLPTATLEWTMKGLGQPDAVPLSPPAASVVPSTAATPIPLAAATVPAQREPATPVPARASPSPDEPTTVRIRLPRSDVPPPRRSVKPMAIVPVSAAVPPAPPVRPVAPRVVPLTGSASVPRPRHAAPASTHGPATPAPLVPSSGPGRHARP